MILSFSNLKGGVGKSMMTAAFSNYLAYKGFTVCLVDADVSQHTSGAYMESDVPLDGLERIYYNFNDGDLVEFVQGLSDLYDFVLVDIPGTIQQEGVLSVLGVLDKVIVPTTLSNEDVVSTTKFIEYLKMIKVPFKILMNNYEIQFDAGMRQMELNGFVEVNDFFDLSDSVFKLGMRKERSVLQNKFELGSIDVTSAKGKRVVEVMDLVYNYVIS